jgi:divalent metal cation (Fe/Co/Zn/Cd) transporter
MKPVAQHDLPDELKPVLRRVIRLEIWTLLYQLTVAVLMFLAMGSSQAMKTAWLEDSLGIVPPIAFFISTRLRNRPPDREHPYGWHSAVSIAFLAAALALLAMGLYLLIDSLIKLLMRERATVGTVNVFGHLVWLGWFMLIVLAYSVFPAMYLGWVKLEPARQLHDKTLFADGQVNKASWLTGVAAMVGVCGIGMGIWWLDATAGALISLDVTRDGLSNVKTVIGDLMNREPRTVDNKEADPLPGRLVEELGKLAWVREARVRLRESGHVYFGEAFIVPNDEHDLIQRGEEATQLARSLDWRVNDLVVQFVSGFDAYDVERQGNR